MRRSVVLFVISIWNILGLVSCSDKVQSFESQSCSLPSCIAILAGPDATSTEPEGSDESNVPDEPTDPVEPPNPPNPTNPTEPPPSPEAPVEILIEPLFKTAGIIIKLPPNSINTVTARVFYKRSVDSAYQEGHKFTKYDLNNMATSLFYLTPDTSYDVRVDYFDGAVTSTKFAKFSTKADRGISLPAALRVINVSSLSTLQSAVNNALPGDHIVVAPGTYLGSVTISNKLGTAANPIVIRGASYFDPKNAGSSPRAVFDGNNTGKTFSFVGSAFWILDNVEVKNAYASTIADYTGSGIHLYSSSNITIQRSYIHDNGFYNISIGKSDTNTAAFGGPLKTGHHLIQENFITDTSDRSACEATQYPYNGCTGITYEGIYIGKSSGGANVIRGNRITNMIDGITIPGDGAYARELSESVPHVLKLTSTAGLYMNHDNEAYGNELYDNFDDDIECDGIGVNIRIYDNVLGSSARPAHHALTAAPFMPGPLFIVRNIVKNYKNSALKMNTGGDQSIPSRNVYMYHNTFVKLDSARSLLNLWYGGEGATGFKNGHFINNIFYAPNGGRCTSINTSNYGGPPGTTLDHNVWYTPTTSSSLFQWYNGSVISNASSLSGFKINSGQEAGGLFMEPAIDSYYAPMTGSPAIDRAVRIPGINNRFNGNGPDIGAKEY